jgi:uncharacterized protein
MNTAAAEPALPTEAGPRPPSERLLLMDALRGFALLGILLMNIEFFSRPMHDFTAGLGATEGADGLAGWIVYVFVQGKFWVLFSLLFGMGFALMRERLEADGRPFARLYLRRTLALAAIGVAHIVLLWPGDILLAYALTALCLMLFMPLSGRWLWILGLLFYFGTTGLMAFMGWAMGLMPEEMRAEAVAQMAADYEEGLAGARIYAEGGYLAITAQRASDYFGYMLSTVLMFQVPTILGVFLFGSWLQRSGRIAKAREHQRFWLLLGLAGLVVGALLVGASLGIGTRFDPVDEFDRGLLAMAVMMLGNLPVALAYLSIFVLLFQTRLGSMVLGLLAPAGRMALTHYLTQSLVLGLLFYGYGLGWYGEVGRLGQVQIALLLFAAQAALSPMWLRYFRYGPMEWLWRGMTYGQLPPFRRQA